jgi:hypothetical protein
MLAASACFPSLFVLQRKHKNIHSNEFYAGVSRFCSSPGDCRAHLLFSSLTLPRRQIISTGLGNIVAKINEWLSGNYCFVFAESWVSGRSFRFPISGRDWESRISSVELFPSNSTFSNLDPVFVLIEIISLVLNSIRCLHSRIRYKCRFLASVFHDLLICHHFLCEFFMELNQNHEEDILYWERESMESEIEK